jgi:hypothetical protein
VAFDPNIHDFHPHSGLMRHKETGRLVGIEHHPPHDVVDLPKPADPEWPKWVTPHESHVVRTKRGDHKHIATPRFAEHHVHRDTSEVTVLVHSPEEEDMARGPLSPVLPHRLADEHHPTLKALTLPASFEDEDPKMTDIAALADKISGRVHLKFSEHVHPETRHLHDTAVAVARHLGMETDALNVRHVMSLLASHAKPAAYPKMKFHHGDRKMRTVASHEEEQALGPEWVDEYWEG